VFPLSGALLLPRARLPLNIFEPRYLAMIDAAMDGHRLIGMIQPRDATEERAAKPALVGVGCVGRIVEYSETEDGRYVITLLGLARFRQRAEREEGMPFRQIETDYTPYAADMSVMPDPELPRDRLLAALKPYLAERDLKTDWTSLEEAPPEMLVNALAMICPFDPGEKQALLESPGLKERAETLTALIEIANASAPTRGKQPIH